MFHFTFHLTHDFSTIAWKAEEIWGGKKKRKRTKTENQAKATYNSKIGIEYLTSFSGLPTPDLTNGVTGRGGRGTINLHTLWERRLSFQKRNGLTQDLTWFQLALNLDTRNCQWVHFFSPTLHTENIAHGLEIWNKYVSAGTLYFPRGMNTCLYYIYLHRCPTKLSLHMDTGSHVKIFNTEGKKFGDFKKDNLGQNFSNKVLNNERYII